MTSNFWQRSGLTPGKAALIGVLVCVLGAVVGYQVFSGSYGSSPAPVADSKASTETTATRFQPQRRGDARQMVSRSSEPAQTVDLPVESWPKIPLVETLAHNPFATPAALIPPPIAVEDDLIPFESPIEELEVRIPVDPAKIEEHRARVRAIRELMTRGATMVLTGADGKRVAVVNGRTIGVDDTIHGMRVTDITSEGVVLEAISADQ